MTPATARPALSKTSHAYAIRAVLLATFCYAATDAAVKWLSGRYGIVQITFLRNVFALLPVAVVVRHAGGLRSLKTRRPALNVLRGGLGLLSMFLYFHAFSLMALADVIAIGFTSPLILVLLCRLVLGERVEKACWIAVGAGLAGMVVIVQPGLTALRWHALLPVGGAVCLALYMLMLRVLAGTESKSTLMLYVPAVAVAVTGAALIPVAFVAPTAFELSLFAAMGVISGVALLLRNEAYSTAPASVLAPFEYTGLIWVSLIGAAVFSDYVTPALIVGSTIIVSANFYVVMRRDAP
jgi:drug/metabolite transporter (DMT)-like permease